MTQDDLSPRPHRVMLGWPDRHSMEVGGLYVDNGDGSVWEFVGVAPTECDPAFLAVVAPELDRFDFAALTEVAMFKSLSDGTHYAHRCEHHRDGVSYARLADLMTSDK
jgi:hypothetical protein